MRTVSHEARDTSHQLVELCSIVHGVTIEKKIVVSEHLDLVGGSCARTSQAVPIRSGVK